MKIGIIGLGVVGSAVEYGMKRLGHKVFVHDLKLNSKISDVFNTDICYICVPTPTSDDGSCDVSIVENVIKDLNDNNYNGIIAIKSTVTPGTTKRLSEQYKNKTICFVPEFLRERCAIADFVENHDLLVIGTADDNVYELIKKSHGKFPKKTVKVTSIEAEFCKYFNNVYNATLITFANSFYELCKASGVNYTNVKEAIVNRNNISDVYLNCNENVRGFGGMCLPKDTSAISSLVRELNLDVDFFDMVLSENEKYKTTVFNGMRE
jgi:UDPglucose 6-dehydrogenase